MEGQVFSILKILHRYTGGIAFSTPERLHAVHHRIFRYLPGEIASVPKRWFSTPEEQHQYTGGIASVHQRVSVYHAVNQKDRIMHWMIFSTLEGWHQYTRGTALRTPER